ncbi:TPA: restriction endonuclease subunit S [Escherichia coli]|nr:restriction endonuclease subunit S [Escherichia coli]HBA9581980.1 restriction endonuclease subunit S [Escherichia coli]HBA9586094.1 restriction endonuclease subunit S [Escherichia coli]
MQARIKNVPHGWQFTYVGKAFSIRNNLRKPISEEERSMSPGNYPYYGPTKIQGYIGTYEQDGSYALIGEDGDHFLKFEKHSMTQLVDGKCTVNNHAHIIEGTKEASREWFYYYFMHRDIFSFLSRQGAGRYKLNKASLEKMPLLLPPIAEQKKIAQILSTWDKAISVTEKLLTNSQQQKKALMQQLLSGKKRLLDENGVMFSGEWEVVRLKQLIHEEKKRNRDNHIQRVLSVTNHSGFVLPEEQFSKRVASEDVSTYKIVKKNQYGYNPSRLNVGSFARLDNYDEGVLSPVYVVFSINHERLNSDYFLNWMSSNEAKQRIAGSTQGSVRDSVGFDALCSFSFSLPTLMEQQKIAAVLSAADAEMSMLEKKLACLKEEKKALMQQLLTGKRRVKVESEETVSP